MTAPELPAGDETLAVRGPQVARGQKHRMRHRAQGCSDCGGQAIPRLYSPGGGGGRRSFTGLVVPPLGAGSRLRPPSAPPSLRLSRAGSRGEGTGRDGRWERSRGDGRVLVGFAPPRAPRYSPRGAGGSGRKSTSRS